MTANHTTTDPTALGAAAGDAAGQEAIRFEGVTKRFGSTVAVDDLTLSVRRGEFFSLLGPSGCGKTTTLRMVAGFEQPTEGRVYLEGEPVDDVPPYSRNVNTVFQSYALFEHLDVEGNVAFGLKRRKVPADEIRARVAEALELVQLTGREGAKPRQLSGGQMQRVALARALVNRPAVLLLDEPLGALDLKLRKQMQVELKEIQREVGITFLYVTHDQEEALAMSDRIAVMDEGAVQQLGPPEEIYESPQKTFVAGFIGVSNLLPATVEGGGVRLQTGQLLRLGPSRWLRGRRLGLLLRAPGEDLPGRPRGRHGLGGGRDRGADLPRHDDPGDRPVGARRAGGRAGAEHRSLACRRPLGDRPSGPARMAPGARAGAPLSGTAAVSAATPPRAAVAPSSSRVRRWAR